MFSVCISGLLALILGLSATGDVLAAVRAAAHQGYGRVVFDWPDPVRYAVVVSGHTLSVTFSDPLQGDLASVQRSLPTYIGAGRLSADRKTATFTLKSDYQANAFTLGTSIVVDLRPATGTAETSAKKSQPSQAKPSTVPMNTTTVTQSTTGQSTTGQSTTGQSTTGITQMDRPIASDGPMIRVRTGTHDGYERIVFDWPRPVPYTVSSEGGQATVTFLRPATLDVERLRGRVPPFLKSLSAQSRPTSLLVRLPIPKGGRVCHFTSGPKVVLDVLTSAKRTDCQPMRKKTKPPAVPPVVPPVVNPPIVDPSPAGPASVRGEDKKKTVLKTVMQKEEKDTPEGRQTDGTGVSGTPSLPQVKPLQGGEPRGDQSRTDGSTPPADSAGEEKNRQDAGEKKTTQDRAKTVASLSFSWGQPTAAAVFQRGAYYWIVFDRHQNVDIPLLKKLGGVVIRGVEQIPNPSATVVRLLVEPGYNASLRRDGLLWVVDFMRQPYKPAHPIEVDPQARSPVGARLFLPVVDSGQAVDLLDPEIGDHFTVVPVTPLGTGVFPLHSYPDADLPVTIQGILVEPHTDRVVVTAARTGVDVTAQGGMIFSPDIGRMQAMATIGTPSDAAGVLDIGAWKRGGKDTFLETRQMLQSVVVQVPEQQRNGARLDLARFFFANGYAAEALGLLSVIADDEPTMANAAAFKALHGAANFMMGRWDEAVADFTHPSLSDVEGVPFWRALAQAQMGQPEVQAQTIRDYGGVIGSYPRALKVPLALMAAQSTAAAADDLATTTFLTTAKTEDNTAHEKAALRYIEGKRAEAAGHYDDALEAWSALESNRDRYYRAMATRDRLDLLYRMEELDRPNLIKGLERLRFAWRGGPFELSLLMRLGDLYEQEKDYGKALRAWQQAALYFQNRPGGDRAMGRMHETFDRLYHDGLADSMPPLSAIALYDEFRDLTPTGKKGDDMIRHLADRLVSVDLLPQAAALLERQVTYRLTGSEKARVGARLGLVYLLDHKPQKAVESLLQSGSSEISAPLERQRQQLLARALSDLGRSDEAIILLEGDESRSANLLRAEIEWKTGNWKAAATALDRVVPKGASGIALTDEDSRLVLDRATALTLAQDEQAVAAVRRRYLSSMAKTPFKDAFDLITTPPTSGVIDYRTVAERIKQAEDFQTFLAAYRERLRDGGLSTIN